MILVFKIFYLVLSIKIAIVGNFVSQQVNFTIKVFVHFIYTFGTSCCLPGTGLGARYVRVEISDKTHVHIAFIFHLRRQNNVSAKIKQLQIGVDAMKET